MKERISRVPVMKQAIIDFEQREGYVRRLIPEHELYKYVKAGYIPVENKPGEDADKSDKRSDDKSRMGSVVTKRLNSRPDAPWHDAVLVEIEQKYYDEDCALERAKITSTEQLISRNLHGGGLVDPQEAFAKYK
jgi:hypothetical protein